MPRNLFTWLLRYSPGAMLASVLAGAIAGATGAAMLAVLNNAINHPGGPAARHEQAWLFAVLCVLAPAARIGSAVLIGRFGQSAIHDIRMRLSRAILAMPLIDLEKAGPERLLVVLTDDLGAMADALSLIPVACMNAFVVLGCLGFMGWLSPALMGAFLALAVIGVSGYRVPFHFGMRWQRRVRDEWDNLFIHFRGLTEGHKELKLHRERRQDFLDSLESSSQAVRGYSLKALLAMSGASSWGQALAFVLLGLLVFASPPRIAGGQAVLNGYVLTLLYMVGPIQSILNGLPSFGRAGVAVRRVEGLGLSLAQVPAEPAPAPGAGAGGSWRSLRLVDVVHTYPGEDPRLRFRTGPITLTLYPHEIVFLTGGNGSGKTTLAKLIVGLYLPDAGEVWIDDAALTTETQLRHRSHFTAIFSDYFLFERLFGFAGPDLDERVRGHLAHLGLEHKVDVQQGVFSTTRLSQGQRSRLALL
ncbi:MAG TPA: cyclic peptide export ABC transporter, partial [Caulobacteraceae bacterium]|nr:cyclic peptide export ABC transporter [Caulobacteraceae bacterium]